MRANPRAPLLVSSSLISLRTACLLALVSGCTWGRFDDVTENAPVVLLQRPKQVQGFGYALSTTRSEGGSLLLVAGAPGASTAAAFDLGSGEGPALDAIASDLCVSNPPGDRCFLGSAPVALGEVDAPDGSRMGFCFAVGAGSAADGQGLIVDCVGKERSGFVLPVPEAFDTALSDSLREDEAEPLAMSSDGASVPDLLVGARHQKLAWVYAAMSAPPVELLPPGTRDPSYGAGVASLPFDEDRLYAISAPEEGHVFLFKAHAAETPTYAGCLGGILGFGRSLAFGRVTADADPELLISDAHNVHVFEARKLLELDGGVSASCSLASLPAAALFASFGCGSTGSVSGCESSEFGAALAVADLDGDGDGEVVVGAPRMKVRDKDGAGAILIYDVENPGKQALSDLKFISSAESNDLLGFSVTSVPAKGRDLIVAGAPGAGIAAVFHCSSLVAPHEASGHCL